MSKHRKEDINIDPFDTPNFYKEDKSKEYPPLATPEQLKALDDFCTQENISKIYANGEGIESGFDENSPWIQTFTGRRFCPTNPNPKAIVIQDIAHSLSMLCRFTGHCKDFYSVAQHSVLVSYICDSQDALWGLLHDASEYVLQDLPRPLKHSGKLDQYIKFEEKMQQAICTRFNLPFEEPLSVKKADTQLLSTEARDLLTFLHSDWTQPIEPLPFRIEAWDNKKAEMMFLKRFYQLMGAKNNY